MIINYCAYTSRIEKDSKVTNLSSNACWRWRIYFLTYKVLQNLRQVTRGAITWWCEFSSQKKSFGDLSLPTLHHHEALKIYGCTWFITFFLLRNKFSDLEQKSLSWSRSTLGFHTTYCLCAPGQTYCHSQIFPIGNMERATLPNFNSLKWKIDSYSSLCESAL